MLDFYLIKDDQSKPSYPEQEDLEFITGLDFNTFDSLINKGIIDSNFDYYSDFRWSFDLIKQINLKVLKSKKTDTDFDKLNLIIKRSLKLKCGIIAYCD